MAKGLNDFPPHIQTLILAVVGVALAAVAFWYFDLPVKQQRDEVQAKVQALKAENEKNEAFRAQQTEYLNRIKQLRQQLTTLASIVPNKSHTDQFITLLHTDSLATDTHIRSFTAQPIVQKDLYVELPFSIHMDGTYYQLVNFFDRLAHAQRIVTVSNLTLGKPGGGPYKLSKTETVGANCVVTTYYNSPASATGTKPPAKRR